MTRPPRLRMPAAPEEWTRRRLQILLAVAVTVVVALLAGGLWSIRAALHEDPDSGNATGVPVDASSPEDRVAMKRLPEAAAEDAQPGPLSTGSTGTIRLPQPRALGAAQVQTGFPHTTEGALAQLVAIDQRALGSASVVTAQDVIASWVAPGGPNRQTWSGVRAVAALLSAAGMPAEGTDSLQVVLRPAMGLVKGRVGEDFVVPCVDFVATITTPASPANPVDGPVDGSVDGALGGGDIGARGGAAVGTFAPVRVAVADCQRMAWRGNRWVIGPGAEPAPSPSIWPGTVASYEAGYQWLRANP